MTVLGLICMHVTDTAEYQVLWYQVLQVMVISKAFWSLCGMGSVGHGLHNHGSSTNMDRAQTWIKHKHGSSTNMDQAQTWIEHKHGCKWQLHH